MSMKYLVTGGAGFIGSHLVENLVAAGHQVVVLDDFSSGTIDNLAAVRNGVRIIEGTITDPETCRRAARGVDYVLHQAALTSVTRSVEAPIAAHEVNVTGTVNVLLAARDAGVRRVVFAGSTAVYGDAAELPNREDMVPRPLSPYAVTKLAAEAYCAAFTATYGLETVVLRYFNVFGPRQDPASAYAAAIPKFIVSALRKTPPIIYGDGEQTRDFVFVTNVVHANLKALEAPAPAASGKVFNVGCGRQITVNELWRQIESIVGVRLGAKHAPARAGEIKHSLASIERAREALGYAPLVAFEEAMRRTVQFYKTAASNLAEARRAAG